MISQNFKQEEILIHITTYKLITTKNLVLNILSNPIDLVTEAISETINVVLTKDNLYIEDIKHPVSGYIDETINIIKIPLSELKTFSVRSYDSDEHILLSSNNVIYKLIRDNRDNKNLAQKMKDEIDRFKNN